MYAVLLIPGKFQVILKLITQNDIEIGGLIESLYKYSLGAGKLSVKGQIVNILALYFIWSLSQLLNSAVVLQKQA